jgi:hypothetical protein
VADVEPTDPPDELRAILEQLNEDAAARQRLLESATRGPVPPYDELDPPIVTLVRALNQLPGIYTGGSCGGHEESVSPVSAPANAWWIGFGLERIAHEGELVAVPTDEAWLSLEFLAWFTQDFRGTGADVDLRASSHPPWINIPGQTLGFVLEGFRDGERPYEPDELADELARAAIRFYIPADFAWREDDERGDHS